MTRRWWWRTSREILAADLRPSADGWSPPPRPDLDRAAACLDQFDRQMRGKPWWTYPRIDREHRSRTLSVPEWFPDWHLIRPEDVDSLADRPGCRSLAAELLSMHPDGYVREAAVGQLTRVGSFRALPLLLVRAADWVGPVRERARTAVRVRLSLPEWAEAGWPEALHALPLLEQMAAEGTRSGAFASEVLSRVQPVLSTSHLLVGLRHHDRRLRRASARVLAARGETTGDVLTTALGQDDIVTANMITTAALQGSESADALAAAEVIEAVWTSPYGSLRALALHRAQTTASPAARSLSETGLFDRSPSVRLLAQRWLADLGVDLRERYESALPEEVAALHGLAEVASRAERDEVAELLTPYLRDGRIRAREFAVQATAATLGASSVPILVTMMDDPSPGVLRAVGRALARERLGTDALDDLWSRVLATDHEAVRRAAFKVFEHQDRWPRLVLACRALVAAFDRSDDGLRERGERLLANTSASWNRSFTRPTPAQIDELDHLVPIVARGLPPANARDLLHLLEHFR